MQNASHGASDEIAQLSRRVIDLERQLAEMEFRTELAQRETELAYWNMRDSDRQLAEVRETMARELIKKDEQERTLERQLAEARETPPRWQPFVIAFARAILHGDMEHRGWLLEAADAFVAGMPIPEARGGGNKEARIAKLERQLAEARRGLTDIAAMHLGCSGLKPEGIEEWYRERARAALQDRAPSKALTTKEQGNANHS